MIQSEAAKIRSRRLAAVFGQLDDTSQTYMDTLTAQLAEIQSRCKRHVCPETRRTTGKTPKSIVEQKKEQKE